MAAPSPHDAGADSGPDPHAEPHAGSEFDAAADDHDAADEALSWAGDEEQGRMRPRLAGAPDDVTLDQALDAFDEPVTEGAARDIPGAVIAVVFGIAYLALAVGWIYSVQLTTAPAADLFSQVVWQFGEFAAMVASPVWFAAVISLTRGRAIHRLGWLALGAGVLLPWPILVELAG